jgi:hypothetical protein
MSLKKLKDVLDEDLINYDGFVDKLSPGFAGHGSHEVGYLIDYTRRLMEMQRRLKKSTNISSVIMIILTFVLIVLTIVLIWQGFKYKYDVKQTLDVLRTISNNFINLT